MLRRTSLRLLFPVSLSVPFPPSLSPRVLMSTSVTPTQPPPPSPVSQAVLVQRCTTGLGHTWKQKDLARERIERVRKCWVDVVIEKLNQKRTKNKRTLIITLRDLLAKLERLVYRVNLSLFLYIFKPTADATPASPVSPTVHHPPAGH